MKKVTNGPVQGVKKTGMHDPVKPTAEQLANDPGYQAQLAREKLEQASAAADREGVAKETVREPRVVYDMDAMDDRIVKKIYLQAERCKVEGKAVAALFEARRFELDCGEICVAADKAIESAQLLKQLVALARVAMVALGLIGVLALAGCGSSGAAASAGAVSSASTSSGRPVCLDGKCSR